MSRLSNDAISNPVARPRREIESGDQELRPLDAIETRDDIELLVVSENILKNTGQLERLAFNEDVLTIRISRGRERNAPVYERAAVQGEHVWLPVEMPVHAKRKFVEVLLQAQPMDVRTACGEDESDALTFNHTYRTLSSKCSLSVIHDPSPKGAAWLSRVMYYA